MAKRISKRKVEKALKEPKNEVNTKPFEEKKDLAKLFILVVIVDISQSNIVEKLLQGVGSSMQITHTGRGTASKEILNVLGATDETKGIVVALISEDHLNDATEELDVFFKASKKHRGVAFTVPFSSVQGVKIYKYLTQTI